MNERLQALAEDARREISQASDPNEVERLRIKYLGRKGELSAVLGGMGKLSPEERRSVGEIANRVKSEIEELLKEATRRAEETKLEAELRGPALDITLPGRPMSLGHRHPVSITLEEMISVFSRLGYEVVTGPEIEYDAYNFEALNIPKDHPARDMQDTFYIEQEGRRADPPSPLLLRAHTSPVQIRTMMQRKPPLRVIAPGRVYRRDSDITHSPMFHQVEGLYVDKNVTLAQLKGTLNAFATAFFGADTKTRFRPSFFPFTEPSGELDVSCLLCRGKGCRACKMSGWMELLGSGMVHPNVFSACGYDPAEVTGFAFGIGVDRIALLRYGIDDLRLFFENDVRFLRQF
jgi:phenylalanyl-tRNA synthetase alpha chain